MSATQWMDSTLGQTLFMALPRSLKIDPVSWQRACGRSFWSVAAAPLRSCKHHFLN